MLLRKIIISADEAGCPCCGTELETANHLIFCCPFVVQFWRWVGLSVDDASVGALQSFDAVPAVRVASPGAFVLLCCWQLWKRINAVVFRNVSPSLAATFKDCRDDAGLWRSRFKMEDRPHVDSWLSVLRPV
ncbi:hypothetical protein ZWY2020_015658 [Hordeum vulgare]|nr:hypothetical protein ZWY2020_015658 [Hordeum vulgare]